MVVLCWGCMVEKEIQPTTSQSNTQSTNALAGFFEQKLQEMPRTRSGALEKLIGERIMLKEYVRMGTSKVYGGNYLIVPLRQKSSGVIDAALVYPFIDGADHTLSSGLKSPLLLDEKAMSEIPRTKLFLISNKFLSWKKKGLSVARPLYAFAESLDGKSIYTPSSKSSTTTISGK